MKVLRVLKPGLGTTIQDLGRRDCLELGLPTGGAADLYSHRLANAIVGNKASAATLEMVLLGGSFEVMRPTFLAATGAIMPMQVNGENAPMGEPLELQEGDVLSFGKANAGCFGYLAVPGGFDGTTALGSLSTYRPGRLGGYFGRALRKDDVLGIAEDSIPSPRFWSAPQDLLEWPHQNEVLRFIRGPQTEYFTPEAYETFTGMSYEVLPKSDRMAYRFAGPALEVTPIPRTDDTGSGPTDIVEDGNAVGAIQVPGGTEPICMGRDCPSTGAYAKVGCLISTDVSRMAQLQPGNKARFQEVSVDVAHGVAEDLRKVVAEFGSS